MLLRGKIVVITGGTRGIGKAIVQTFAKEGAHVLFTYLKNDKLAKEIESNLKKEKAKAKGYKVDVKDYQAVDEWKERILDESGKVDILINNAGIIKDKALAMMSKQDWDEVIDTNLNGLFNTTKSFIVTFLKQKEGNIINISSLSGIIGISRQTNYSASKGGMIAFSKSLAKEAAPYNVRVNVIAPGFIETDMIRGLKEDQLKLMKSQIPMGRFGDVYEVAKAALFLATDKSSYITGQVVRIDGGLGM
jgi:3-oxoacyl-[acyl-carrier protein] reductase